MLLTFGVLGATGFLGEVQLVLLAHGAIRYGLAWFAFAFSAALIGLLGAWGLISAAIQVVRIAETYPGEGKLLGSKSPLARLGDRLNKGVMKRVKKGGISAMDVGLGGILIVMVVLLIYAIS